jgi:hypothetical protein
LGKAAASAARLKNMNIETEQDCWLLENREEINVKIQRGIAQLDRGEGIPEDQLDAYLADLKTKSE